MTGKTVSGLIFSRTLSFFKNSRLFCYCSLVPRSSNGFCRCFAFQIGKICCPHCIIRHFQFRKCLPVNSNLFLYNLHKKFQIGCILRMTYGKINQSIFLRCRHLSDAIIMNPAILSARLSGCIHPSKFQKTFQKSMLFIHKNEKQEIWMSLLHTGGTEYEEE